MVEEKEIGHPLDRQNAIERDIQLKGGQDPDNFKMPDGRTLAQVRQANQVIQDAEYQEEIQMLARRTREQSIPEFQKGKNLVMTSAGNIIDVTESVVSEDPVTMAKSRTTAVDISEGAIPPLREREGVGSLSSSGETASPSGKSLGSSSPTLPGSSTPPSSPTGLPKRSSPSSSE